MNTLIANDLLKVLAVTPASTEVVIVIGGQKAVLSDTMLRRKDGKLYLFGAIDVPVKEG